MQENGLVTLAVCGLALVCLGVTVIGALLVLRLTGQIVLPTPAGQGEISAGRLRLLRPRRARRVDLQAQADALDFDAALAQAAARPDQPPLAVPLPPNQPPLPRPRVIQPPWEDESDPGFFPDVDE